MNEWQVGQRGLAYDRQWMIVNDSGICLTQKREPRLCLVKPTLDLVNGVLLVSAPGSCIVHVILPFSLTIVNALFL